MKIGNIEAYGIVYKITNKVNKKVYIGITTKNNKLKDRYSAKGKTISEKIYKTHLREKENNRTYNSHLLRAMQKYGYENFEVIEIFDVAFSLEELRVKEKSWINIYQSNNPDCGYNKTSGGEGTIGYSFWYEKDEKELKRIREKRSKSMIGKNNPMYGKSHWENKTDSEKELVINKRRETMDNKTSEELAEISKKISIANSGVKNANARPVICITTKRIFQMSKDGAKFYNIKNPSCIGRCCRGERKTSGEFNGKRLVWKFLTWKHNKKYRMH